MSAASAPKPWETRFLAAARGGDQAAFAALAERYRAELQLHCYRMLGSLQDAEDLVQETLLRAWAKRSTFQGRSTFRAWLYGIATHACLDALRRRPKRVLPAEVFAPADPTVDPRPAADLEWLEPFPDRLLDEAAANQDAPEARVLEREATELAFLAAIQHLPARQRAVLILRDVVGWSAKETAATLGSSVAAVNSALQRAHATLADHLTARAPASTPGDPKEMALLHGLIAAWEGADVAALAALLTEDVRLVMPPTPSWYEGRDAIETFFAKHAFADADFPQRVCCVSTGANRQPTLAVYLRGRDASEREPFALIVIDAVADGIREMTLFRLPQLFAAWGLPARL